MKRVGSRAFDKPREEHPSYRHARNLRRTYIGILSTISTGVVVAAGVESVVGEEMTGAIIMTGGAVAIGGLACLLEWKDKRNTASAELDYRMDPTGTGNYRAKVLNLPPPELLPGPEHEDPQIS